MKYFYSPVMLFFGVVSLTFASITPYFSPSGGCTDAIVMELGAAQKSVLVQAYSFTSAPIAEAVAQAKKRGCQVIVILDKSQETQRYSAATFLRNQGIETWIDYQPAIAHSKVIIIDESTLITGSFNFTKAAEEKNVENLLIIKGEPNVIKQYLDIFQKRKSLSRLADSINIKSIQLKNNQ